MLQPITEAEHGQAIFDLLKQAKITGLPVEYADLKEYLVKNTLLGRLEDGVLQSAFIIVPDTRGMAYMQAVFKDQPEPSELREGVADAFEADPTLEAVWTQEAVVRVAEYLRAGFIPITPLNVSMPVLCLTRFSMAPRA